MSAASLKPRGRKCCWPKRTLTSAKAAVSFEGDATHVVWLDLKTVLVTLKCAITRLGAF